MTRTARILTMFALAATLGCGTGPAVGATPLKAIWGPGIEKGVSRFPIYHDLGMRVYEDRLAWAEIARVRPRHPTDPRDPAYLWPKEVAEAVAQAKIYHIKAALQIIGAPSWANGGKSWNWAPKSAYDYAKFVTAAARRYPSVHMWMVWGEPSRTVNFNPLIKATPFAKLNTVQQVAPHVYARLLDTAYDALKRLSPTNLVIGGMTYTTGEISTQQWIENLRLPDGKPPKLDMYGHNPFSFREPNFANSASPLQQVDFSDLPRLAHLVDRYLGRPGNRHPKLFISEWTVPTDVDHEFNFYVDLSVQAKWIASALRLARGWSRLYDVGWIHLYDEPSLSSGGLLYADGAKKPGYFAWKHG